MIKITNGIFEAMVINKSLNNLCQSPKIPPQTSYQLFKLLKILGDYSSFYTQTKTKLFQEYAEKDANGKLKLEGPQQSVIIIEEKKIEFNIKFQELLNMPIELDIDKIDIKLSEIPKDLISAFDMLFLDNFINFNE